MLYVLRKERPAKVTIVKRGSAPCLLADFYISNPPMIWQLDLKRTSTFRLLLQQDEKGEWDLGIETDKESFKVVAHFDERSEAEECYALVQKTLDKGEARMLHKVLRVGLYILALYIIFNVFVFLFVSGTGDPISEPASQQKVEDPARIQSGVPMAADDILAAPPY